VTFPLPHAAGPLSVQVPTETDCPHAAVAKIVINMNFIKGVKNNWKKNKCGQRFR
jgi:hypothetical protein